jgi:uncharacterized membrane protein YphA (DoxX/SURF4 family)
MNVISSKLPTAARIVLGGMFVFSGLNGLLHFAPMPPMPASAGAFAGALVEAGYFFPLLKSIEVVAGVLLLSGRFVPLALTVLAPVLVNVVAFHAALAPAGLAVPIVLTVLEVYLAYHHRDAFAPLLHARSEMIDRTASERAHLATAA